MDQAIATLKKLPGVLGVCVYDAEQKVMINRMPPFLSQEALAELGEQLKEVLALAREKLSYANEMTLHYDEVSLFVHTFADESILVFGEPYMNGRMVSYSLNMLSKPKTAEAEGGNEVAATEIKATQGVDFSGYVPDLKQRLAKIIGPMADIVFDDALTAWHRAEDPSFDHLLKILGEELDDAEKYERYLELCSEIVEKIRQWEQQSG
ncbi:hypothetical protein [uncultured Desulfuromonas sp.]|uniref:hypothetical protein n=1 Tax=uncultured Desulfuromonas sp. TaxID=181013 RepID=UPI002AAB61A1|nr:hypothetical protein [uncultured Desulfuromonas sp.]